MVNENDIRSMIDMELGEVKLNEQSKQKIIQAACNHIGARPTRKRPFRTAMVFLAACMLCATTVLAALYINSKINVNDETLPELDQMQVTELSEINGSEDTYGTVSQTYTSYQQLVEMLGINLLDTDLESDNPYMSIDLTTDNKDYCFITVENYIIGDVTGFKLIPDGTAYAYEHGKVYYSPVSLSVEIILSQEQLDIGLDKDYLGMYEYVESYRSAQGYKVNILRGTENEGQKDTDDIATEKTAIFVADGIRYTLTGRVSLDTLKEIVDSMQPSE